jgi:hypothetical protein
MQKQCYPLCRCLAIVAGTASAGASIYMICEDAIKSGHWTREDVLVPVMVVCTILFGHLIVSAFRAAKPVAAAGFVLAFSVGTALTINTSVERQGLVADTRSANIEFIASERRRLTGLRDEQLEMLQKEQVLQDKECKSGAGKRCTGIQTSLNTYTGAVAGYQAQLDKLPVVVPIEHRMASVIAVFAANEAATKAKAERALTLLTPFMFSLFFEVGSIVAFGFAFGSSRSRGHHPEQTKPAQDDVKPEPKQTINHPPPRRQGSQLPELSDYEIEALRKAFHGESHLNNKKLAVRMQVHKSEASRRATKAVELGLVSRQRVGREVRLMLL